MSNLFLKNFDQKYEILMSALEGGILTHGSINSFNELCVILDVSSIQMENRIYEEVGLSLEELLDLYKT